MNSLELYLEELTKRIIKKYELESYKIKKENPSNNVTNPIRNISNKSASNK